MTVKLAIVGCGAIAEQMHLPAAAAVPEVRITALVDTDRDRRTRLQQTFNVPRAAEALEAVADETDAVVLCTPPHTHRDLALRALACGLHVLCEKPMANSCADGEAMIAAARRADRVLALAHVFRFYPSRRAVRDWIARQPPGRIRRVAVEQGGVYSWPAVSGYSMRRELTPGGVLLDSGIHPLDTLLWWCGPPQHVEYEDDACGGLESNARLNMISAGGYPVALRLSRTCALRNEFVVETADETLVLHAYSTDRYAIRRGARLEIVAAQSQRITADECSRRQLNDFLESIQGRHPPAVSGADGAAVIGLIEKCYAIKRARPLPTRAPLPGLTW